MSAKKIIAQLVKEASAQALSQPLWCTVDRPAFGESTRFSFLHSDSESTNHQLQGALAHPQQFLLEGYELRVFGSLLAREIATKFSLSTFAFYVADKIYTELPLGAVLWSGALDFPGFRLERPLLIHPMTHFSGRIFWKPSFAVSREQKQFKLSLTLFLLGTLLRPVA